VRTKLAELGRLYQQQRVGVVGIQSNDMAGYPDDSPENMAREIKQVGYTFPYLYDEPQEVAKAYRAACTPDFFLFDAEQKASAGCNTKWKPGNEPDYFGSGRYTLLEAVLITLDLARPARYARRHRSVGLK